MYRKRYNGSRKYNAMRVARLRQIEEGPAPDYPRNLPEFRRRIIIEDFDFGQIRHEINLYKTSRTDCYRMEVDGAIIMARIGWAKVLEKVRKSFLRVQACQ
jgi:hypothetical protein